MGMKGVVQTSFNPSTFELVFSSPVEATRRRGATSAAKKKTKYEIPEGCCAQCYFAHPFSPCDCQCGGVFHGLGNKLVNKNLDEYYEPIADESINRIIERGRCVNCGASLRLAPVYGYPHEDGVEISGRKYWVFAVCPECGHQNALGKILRQIEAEEKTMVGMVK